MNIFWLKSGGAKAPPAPPAPPSLIITLHYCSRKNPVGTCRPDSRNREISGNQAWKQKLNDSVSFIITSLTAPWRIIWQLQMATFCHQHPKWDQNPWFVADTASIRVDLFLKYFSWRHRLHFFLSLWYGLHVFRIPHLTWNDSFRSLIFQMCFDSSVSFLFLGCRKDVWWFLYRSLKFEASPT